MHGFRTILLRLLLATVVFASAAPSGAQTPADLERAEAAATEAKALFKNKVYADAASLFMKAYAISKRPNLVYNAARAYQELGKLKRSESLFLMYLGLDGVDAQGKAAANKQLKAVRARLKTQPGGAAETGSGAAGGGAVGGRSVGGDDQPHTKPGLGLPWLPIGVVALGFVGAGGLYLQARSLASDLDLAAVGNDDQAAAYRDDRDQAVLLRNIAIGAAVVGVGAGVWAWLSMRADTAEKKGALWLLPGPNGLVVGGAW